MTDSELMPRQRLAAELRRLRELAGVSGRLLSARTGMSQSTISRVEAATRVPSRPEVTAWADAVDATDDARQRLAALTEAVHTAVHPFQQGDTSRRQDEIRGVETDATRVRNFQPTLVPGLLQTAEYVRRIMPVVDPTASSDDLAAAVASRLLRQEALYDPGRRWEFLLTESALLWPSLPPPVLVGQLDRIASVATLDNVKIGILSRSALPVAPWHNYVIYERDEDAVVHVELTHASLAVSEPDDVAIYQHQFDQLCAIAFYGADAAPLLLRIRDEARRGSPRSTSCGGTTELP